MKQATKNAIDRMAHDAAKSLEREHCSNVSISAWNYGLKSTKGVLSALREYGFKVRAMNIMGYIEFRNDDGGNS